jgi:hypothetical protein
MTRIFALLPALLPALLLWSAPAQAYSCWVIRRAVAQHGEAAVESWTRANGITEKEIERGRRCLR